MEFPEGYGDWTWKGLETYARNEIEKRDQQIKVYEDALQQIVDGEGIANFQEFAEEALDVFRNEKNPRGEFSEGVT